MVGPHRGLEQRSSGKRRDKLDLSIAEGAYNESVLDDISTIFSHVSLSPVCRTYYRSVGGLKLRETTILERLGALVTTIFGEFRCDRGVLLDITRDDAHR